MLAVASFLRVILRMPWGFSGPLEASWELLGDFLRAPFGLLGYHKPSWGFLGASWARLGGPLRPLKGRRGFLFVLPGSLRDVLGMS